MLKIKQAIIVEGRYDKIKVSGVVDTLIIETDGFGVFSNREKRALIRKLANTVGIVVLTDSDSAGQIIRSHIKSIAGAGAKVYNAYIPQIAGKEKRKRRPSKAGTLGVEGVDAETIEKALADAGVFADTSVNPRPVTKADLYEDRLTGFANSAERRRQLLRMLGLPEYISANALLDIINAVYSYDIYREFADKLNGG